ncbi:MAG: fumarate hydratase C-terminal domain-containing protein, partial [Eubacteriales bacterium]
MKKISLPLDKNSIVDLHVGDEVLVSGTLYTARDAAHLRMKKALTSGEPLPMD